jgi:Cys-tRNA(Pro)/Cys-tRNA(Cys) deacylase
MQADLSDNSPTPVTQALDRAGVPYRFFRHTGVVRSLEQAAQERGQQPQQVVRSLLFRLAEYEFVMVLVAGPRQLSWPRLRAYLGTKRMTMATDEEVLQVTGYPPGAVSPFGLPQPLRLLVDPVVLDQEEVSIGSGVRNTTVILLQEHLRQALGQYEIYTEGEG